MYGLRLLFCGFTILRFRSVNKTRYLTGMSLTCWARMKTDYQATIDGSYHTQRQQFSLHLFNPSHDTNCIVLMTNPLGDPHPILWDVASSLSMKTCVNKELSLSNIIEMTGHPLAPSKSYFEIKPSMNIIHVTMTTKNSNWAKHTRQRPWPQTRLHTNHC